MKTKMDHDGGQISSQVVEEYLWSRGQIMSRFLLSSGFFLRFFEIFWLMSTRRAQNDFWNFVQIKKFNLEKFGSFLTLGLENYTKGNLSCCSNIVLCQKMSRFFLCMVLSNMSNFSIETLTNLNKTIQLIFGGHV